MFSRKEVEAKFGMSHDDVSKALTRWKSNGLVGDTGARTGVYYNRLVSPDQDDLAAALDRIVRLPHLVIGANALRHAGWVTQRGGELEIAVPVTSAVQSYPAVNDILFCPRPDGWFDKAWKNSTSSKHGIYGIRTLKPEYALVDIIMAKAGLTRKSDKVWRANPDDILVDGEDPEIVLRRCREAALVMGAPLDKVREFLSEISHLEDDIEHFDLDETSDFTI